MGLKRAFYSSYVGQLTQKKTTMNKVVPEAKRPIKIIGGKKEVQEMSGIIDRIVKSSDDGKDLIKSSADNKCDIIVNRGNKNRGFFMPHDGNVYLQVGKNLDESIIFLVHELRHANQPVISTEPYGNANIKSEIMCSRALEADAEQAAIACSYQMYLNGDKEPFKNYCKHSKQVAKPFIDAVEKDGKITNRARTEAFKGWYDDKRRLGLYEKSYDIESLRHIKSKGAYRSFSTTYSSEYLISKVCNYKGKNKYKNNNYFTDDKNILGKDKFLEVDVKHKKEFQDFADWFNKKHNKNFFFSIEEIPSRVHRTKTHYKKNHKLDKNNNLFEEHDKKRNKIDLVISSFVGNYR